MGRSGVDNRIPYETDTIESPKVLDLNRAVQADTRLEGHMGRGGCIGRCAIYSLDSGIRLEHAIELLNSWNEEHLKA